MTEIIVSVITGGFALIAAILAGGAWRQSRTTPDELASRLSRVETEVRAIHSWLTMLVERLEYIESAHSKEGNQS